MFNDVTASMYQNEWSLGAKSWRENEENEGGTAEERRQGSRSTAFWHGRWRCGIAIKKKGERKIGKTTATAETFDLESNSLSPVRDFSGERNVGGKTFLLLYREEKGSGNFLLRREIYCTLAL